MRLAMQMALENANIKADSVAINEYPQLAQTYNVRGVPKTMIDGQDGVEGALPEPLFISTVLLRGTPA